MPVFDVAAATARSLDAIPSYYQGKAIRLALENKALANEALQQEIDAELPERRVAALEKRVGVEEEALEQKIKEYGKKVGEAKALEEANIIIGITEGAKSAKDPLAYANERMPEFIETLSAGEARSKLEKMSEDGFQAAELAELYKFSLAINKQFGGVEAANAKLTADTKFINNLNISDKEKDRLKLQIGERMGAGAASTYDPRTSLSKAGVNTVTLDYRKKVTMSIVGAKSATELIVISYSDPAALGKSGAIVNFGNEVHKTAKNLIDLVSPDPLPASQTKKQDTGWQAFDWKETDKSIKRVGLTPVQAAKFKSGIYSIAFSAAVGEQGARPSDIDIQQYIAIYGGNLTDAQAFRGTIDTAMRRQYNMLKAIGDVNPEIEDAAATLAVFEEAYAEFKLALKGDSASGGFKIISRRPAE